MTNIEQEKEYIKKFKSVNEIGTIQYIWETRLHLLWVDQWCLEQCKYIVNELFRIEKSNASGRGDIYYIQVN